MKKKILFLALLFLGGNLGAGEMRLGVIGLDTSHTLAFTEMLNVKRDDPAFKGFRVTAAYKYGSLSIHSSTNRYPEYTRKMKAMGVEIVPSIWKLLEKVDAVLLETNDGRRHYEQALEVFKAGKPVFIDKPISADLPDAIRIVEASKKYGVPFFSASSLRYVKKAQEAREGRLGRIRGAHTFSPCYLEPTHSDLFWYGVHGVEPLFTIMGRGCETVVRVSRKDTELVVGSWKDGRIGVMRGMRGRGATYGGLIYTDRGPVNMGKYNGYKPLLLEILTFFRTRKPPVSPEETLEIFTFMEAAAESKRRGGLPVSMREVFEKARSEAARRGR